MVILIDLDGTLTDTAHEKFKSMKDGISETVLSEIIVFNGAKEFIESQKYIGNTIIIISDSHPRYVEKIANNIFDLPFLSLCDKPNSNKLIDYISQNHTLNEQYLKNRDSFTIIGDTWLDIELGRKLNISTVLVEFYKSDINEQRDGIGDRIKQIKAGSTFYAKTFNKLTEILEDREQYLLSIEGAFATPSINSFEAVDFKTEKYQNKFTFIRSLARQQQGECDKYAQTKQYFQISNENRSAEFIQTLVKGIENYINHVRSLEAFKNWDIITYVSDKKTTKPLNKMKEIFDAVTVDIKKEKLFEWAEDVDGSLRDRPTRNERKSFVEKYINTRQDIDLIGKNIIILDDQITTSATADILIEDLRRKGARHILFIAFFHLISNVSSEKQCPICGKNLTVKIIRETGVKFFSCVLPRFRGNGCGYTESIYE